MVFWTALLEEHADAISGDKNECRVDRLILEGEYNRSIL